MPQFQQLQTASVCPFPTDALPPLMKNAISYLQNSGKIPAELAANAVLAAVSLACQPLIEVFNPHTNIEEHCALNILTLAQSGTGKSSVSKQVMKPFDEFRERLTKYHVGKLSTYREDYAVWKNKYKALENNLRDAVKKDDYVDEAQAALKSHVSIEPTKPVLPTFVYNDTSISALITGLNEYPFAGLVSDEASNFFDKRLKDNMAFLNKAWDGDTYEFRRSNHEPLSFKPTLTVSLMMQPSLFLDFMKKDGDKALESGFLSRFLFTNIHQNSFLSSGITGHRYCSNPVTRDELALTHFHNQINKLLEKQREHILSGQREKMVLRLSSEAEIYWENLRDSWLALTLQGNAWFHIKPMVLKANTNMLRIAALFSYFTVQETDIISLDVITQASMIMAWYLNHTASWFYQFTDEHKFQQDVQELCQWINQKFISINGLPFKKNDVIKYGPNKFRRSEKLEPLLNWIISTGILAYIKKSPSHPAIYITWRMPNGYYAQFFDETINTYPPSSQGPYMLH
ncbi:DUF3987 domain-containing protein [Dickeya zeae]|nr:DUF3987 domain-containing protein [Dickeya zeae]